MTKNRPKSTIPSHSKNEFICERSLTYALWFRNNGLTVSINKCNSISFHRNLHPIHFVYNIDGENLERVFQICDLGVMLDTNLNFSAHIEYVTGKAYAMLGFVKRICHEFRSIKALKSIFCAHVRSHLEYACTVWQPHCITKKAEIESIQKKFAIYALRRSVRRDSNYSFKLPYRHTNHVVKRLESKH